jgi:hypothetical protein
MKKILQFKTEAKPRLVWTRGEVVEQSGLCCRTIQNLEERGLLERVNIGIDKALYSDKSVRACFKIEGAA